MSSVGCIRQKRFQVARKRAAAAAKAYQKARGKAERTPSRRAVEKTWSLHTRAVILGRAATRGDVWSQPWPKLVAWEESYANN